MAKQSIKYELFNYLYKAFSELGAPVVREVDQYTELGYPFIAIEEIQDLVSVRSFDNYGGEPKARIHLWSDANDLQTHDRLYIQIQDILMKTEQLPSYHVSLVSINTNNVTDDTTNTNLMHTIIDSEFQTL
ncbi:hypothetical protein M4L90_14115 [Staphylococcus equorum]|uniref:DUF3168 domain-containing protein n=1 Tax=Staphylococcus equorum TaxID=246432 RepID=A0A9X4L794_9STAP|nr:hypothetical protein [Staphylococcus equorum]MDG0820951.1 hypothetical protein [Staphylococcus equorum]MDG0841666.1 hypothetical protein [Staphylococcus equorum]MDG0847276.1 hypothetical protein [Staphylococcus equorum]